MLRAAMDWVGAIIAFMGIMFFLYLVSLRYDMPFLLVLFFFLVLREIVLGMVRKSK